MAIQHQTEYFAHRDVSWIMNCTSGKEPPCLGETQEVSSGHQEKQLEAERASTAPGTALKQPLILAYMGRRCYRSGTTQACGIKQLSPQIIDLKHLQLPARNTDTHNSQGSTARLTWREKCFHHLAVSQEHLDCPGHTAGCGRLLTHEVPSLMSSSSSYSTTSCSIISIFRSVKNCVFFSSSTKA